ncbi:MAG: NAD(P)H-dependent oxidoreductase subunit E [Planctomycetes bacterium]|nr:NAD(P)H-dependent oxidoreductase subunit E [Planctomycetota bacterium]
MTETKKKPKHDPAKLNALLEKYPAGDGRGLIHALQDIQAAYNYIPFEAVEVLCRHLDVPLSKAFSAATFYKAFSLDPKGDIIIRICTGTACHIRGAQVLVDELVEKLNIKPGGTTKDLKFTVETVNCVGACAMAPVVSVNGKYHGKVKPGDLTQVVKNGDPQ